MTSDYEKVLSKLLPTWQSLAAIAMHSEIPVKTCEKILVQMYNEGIVMCRRARLDGHNLAHIFIKVEYQTILGVKTPVRV